MSSSSPEEQQPTIQEPVSCSYRNHLVHCAIISWQGILQEVVGVVLTVA